MIWQWYNNTTITIQQWYDDNTMMIHHTMIIQWYNDDTMIQQQYYDDTIRWHTTKQCKKMTYDKQHDMRTQGQGW